LLRVVCVCQGGGFRFVCVKVFGVFNVYDACGIPLCIVSVSEARCA